MFRAWIRLVACAAALAGGCPAEKAPAAGGGETDDTAPPTPDARPRRVFTRPPDAGVPGPVLPAITLDEVKGVVPIPAESRVLTPHRKQKGRERVEVAFCFDRGGLEAAVTRVTEKLTSTGWQVTRDTVAATRDSTDLHASLGDLRLAGMVRRGPWADCHGEKGRIYVLLAVHR